MHRTQIYFEELLFEEIKRQANSMGLSLSAYIRETLAKDLDNRNRSAQKLDLSEFSGMWKGRDITLASIRKEAWK